MRIKKSLQKGPVRLVLAGALLSACLGSKADTELVYCTPSAIAGADQSIPLGASVDLDGSESGVGEECTIQELTFEWSFEAVPVDSATDEASLTDNNTSSAETTAFIPDVLGTYVVSLVVCDYLECSRPDLSIITVSAGDAAPIADAGPDMSGSINTRIELDGSASYDPEGAQIAYTWTLSTVPACSTQDTNSMYDPNSPNAAFLPDCDGLYVASLVVSDGVQWSEPDYATISVSNTDTPPVADAGDSGSLPPCNGAIIELNGNGSYDPEGQALDYSWSLVSTPSASAATDANFDDTASAVPEFIWDVVGEYTFQLQVHDGTYWSPPDIVTFEVAEEGENNRPQANAGDTQAADLEADCTSSSYVWTCDDCKSVEFDLDASSSYDVDGDTLSYSWEDQSGQLVMGGTETAFATAGTPTMAAEYDSASSSSYNVKLTVSDCLSEDDDVVQIQLTCTGVN
jgi:hypothetical protein